MLDVGIKVPLKLTWREEDESLSIDNLDGVEDEIDDIIVVSLPNIGRFLQLETSCEVNQEILELSSVNWTTYSKTFQTIFKFSYTIYYLLVHTCFFFRSVEKVLRILKV